MIFPVLMLLCFSVTHGADYKGSTKGLKKIILGRCFEYLDKYTGLGLLDKVPKPEEREQFCTDVRKKFLDAFAKKDPCGVTEEAYKPFFEATGKVPIKDKVLFWSKHELLSRLISNEGRRAVVLRDTLPGYLTTDLTWCGEVKGPNPDGINFVECPVCNPKKEKGKKEPFEVFWGAASAAFAARSDGIIHHLVNGAVGTTGKNVAYHDETFFHLHELPNIPKAKLKEFRLIVANEPGETVYETCGTGTIKKLQAVIKEKLGKDAICIVNPAMVMHIMCADNPAHPDCVKAIQDPPDKHY